jgi:phosphatidylglycerophosphate synthase
LSRGISCHSLVDHLPQSLRYVMKRNNWNTCTRFSYYTLTMHFLVSSYLLFWIYFFQDCTKSCLFWIEMDSSRKVGFHLWVVAHRFFYGRSTHPNAEKLSYFNWGSLARSMCVGFFCFCFFLSNTRTHWHTIQTCHFTKSTPVVVAHRYLFLQHMYFFKYKFCN